MDLQEGDPGFVATQSPDPATELLDLFFSYLAIMAY